jgi:hypothetical protein
MNVKRWRKRQTTSLWAVILKEALTELWGPYANSEYEAYHSFRLDRQRSCRPEDLPESESGWENTETESMVISTAHFFTFKEGKQNKSWTKQYKDHKLIRSIKKRLFETDKLSKPSSLKETQLHNVTVIRRVLVLVYLISNGWKRMGDTQQPSQLEYINGHVVVLTKNHLSIS